MSDKPKTIMYIAKLYLVGRPLVDVLRDIGIIITPDRVIGEDLFHLTGEEVEIIKAKAPYLVDRISLDAGWIPMEG